MKAPYELAALHVGCGSFSGALYYGLCINRRKDLECRIPLDWHAAGGAYCDFASQLPMWKGRKAGGEQGKGEEADKILSLPEIIRIPGAKEVLICFFCYCAVEQTAGLWASSYLVLYKGMAAETAAGFASMFYIALPLEGQPAVL